MLPIIPIKPKAKNDSQSFKHGKVTIKLLTDSQGKRQ